jgi:apolipoprotein N-acyltransferase
MNTMTLDPPASRRTSRQRELEQLVEQVQHLPPQGYIVGLLAMCSGLLLWTSYPPLDWGPLAWVALVPLLQITRHPEPVSRQGVWIWLGGAVFWLSALQWMRLGDVWMYPAWIAHSCYLACYWPAFIWLTRLGVQRFRLPLLVVAPVCWMGLEYLRAQLFTGFAWYLLGHTQYRWVNLIQISDLSGGYLVSGLVLLGNAAVAECVPLEWLMGAGLVRPGTLPAQGTRSLWLRYRGIAITLALVALAVGYGALRRSHAPFETGPRVALIQGNFPATTKPLTAEEYRETFRVYHALTGLSVPHQPDLVVWPEGMFRWPLLSVQDDLSDEELSQLGLAPKEWRSRETELALKDLANKTKAGMVLGISAVDATRNGIQAYNSAVFVQPERGVQGRYDKVHLVPFGEYIPLARTFPVLGSFVPYGADGGLYPGTAYHVFEHEQWQFIPLICFEDTVPHLVREMVAAAGRAGQPADCLVNLSNDGWFHGSSEHDQHLITAAFRCIETRTPMVRAANMGISAIIDGDGVLREPEVFIDWDAERTGDPPRKSLRDPRTGRLHRQLNAVLVSTVPLDPRHSLYVLGGDWLGIVCLMACAGLAWHGCWYRRTPLPPGSAAECSI